MENTDNDGHIDLKEWDKIGNDSASYAMEEVEVIENDLPFSNVDDDDDDNPGSNEEVNTSKGNDLPSKENEDKEDDRPPMVNENMENYRPSKVDENKQNDYPSKVNESKENYRPSKVNDKKENDVNSIIDESDDSSEIDGGTWEDEMAKLKNKYMSRKERKFTTSRFRTYMTYNTDDSMNDDWDETMSKLKSKIWENESDFRELENNMLDEDMDDLVTAMDTTAMATSAAKELVETRKVDSPKNTQDDISRPIGTPPRQKKLNTVVSHVPDREEEPPPRPTRNRRFGPFQGCIDYLFKSCKNCTS